MRKAVDKIMNTISTIIGVLLLMAVIIVIVQIIFRYVLKQPLSWSNQLCQILYVWIVMLGLPVLFYKKGVTVFDYFSSKLGKKGQNILHILVCTVGIFFAVWFVIFSWQFMMKKGGTMIPAFRVVPYYVVYSSMVISGILLFIELLLQFVETVRWLVTGKEGKE